MRITEGFLLLLQIHVCTTRFHCEFPEEIELRSILAYFNVLRTILFVFSSPYK